MFDNENKLFIPNVEMPLEPEKIMANLANAANPQKAECLLPVSVDSMMKDGKCDVTVYPTESEWFGVTYPEDKPWVVASIQDLIAKGEYPEHLWG